MIFGQAACSWNRKATKTDPSGHYTLDGLTPDRDVLLVQADGFAPSFAPVDSGGNQKIDFKLSKAHSAGVRVVDQTGKPVSGASVSVCCKTPVLGRLFSACVIGSDVYNWLYATAADSAGKVVLNNLPAEGTVLSIYAEGFEEKRAEAIGADTTDRIITLRNQARFGGAVVDAQTCTPIQTFNVKWGVPGIFRGIGDESRAFNRPDGKFIVSVEQPEHYNVRVFAKGYVAAGKMIWAADAATVDCDATFQLQPTYPMNGRVTDQMKRPIAGARVKVIESRGYLFFEVPAKVADGANEQDFVTASDGRFVIDPVMEETATVIVEKDGYPKLIQDDVDLTKPVSLVLTVPAALSVKAAHLAGHHTIVDFAFTRNRCSSSHSI